MCRIELSDNEKEDLLTEMDSILTFVKQVQEANTEEIKPKAGNLKNIFREDENPHKSGEFTDDILNEAPKTEGKYFKVKKIL